MKFLFVISVLFYLIYIIYSLFIVIKTVDKDTISTCQQMAIKNKYDYRNTEFKNFDFYKSCIDNVRYTSPLNR